MRKMQAMGIMRPDGIAATLDSVSVARIDGIPMACGLLEIDDPGFTANDPTHANHVLLKVGAFSCNYRERGIFEAYLQRADARSFIPVGSEICAEVVEAGARVESLAPGDRVMFDNSYPEPLAAHLAPGVPSNHCSQRYLVVDWRSCVRVPEGMDEDHAACFALNAQTIFGMLRRGSFKATDRVLIPAGRSNVSLMALAAAAAQGAACTVVTSSEDSVQTLRALGAEHVVLWSTRESGLLGCEELHELTRSDGDYDLVLDPCADAHMMEVAKFMGMLGRYVTCGMATQTSRDVALARSAAEESRLAFYSRMISKNLSFIGNCLGDTEDLRSAIQMYRDGRLKLHLDSSYSRGEEIAFLQRTFNSRGRLGKVAYRFA